MHIFDGDDPLSAAFPGPRGCDGCRTAALPRQKRDSDDQPAETTPDETLGNKLDWNTDLLL